MTISEQANIIKTALDSWAAAEGGKAFIASDMQNFWEMCWLEATSPRVILCFDREESRGEFITAEWTGAVDRTFAVAVTRGKGMTPDRGENLTNPVGNARAFFDLYEEARDKCRSILNINMDDGRIPNFKSSRRLQMGDLVADGWLFEFSTLQFLPRITDQPTDTTAIPL